MEYRLPRPRVISAYTPEGTEMARLRIQYDLPRLTSAYFRVISREISQVATVKNIRRQNLPDCTNVLVRLGGMPETWQAAHLAIIERLQPQLRACVVLVQLAQLGDRANALMQITCMYPPAVYDVVAPAIVPLLRPFGRNARLLASLSGQPPNNVYRFAVSSVTPPKDFGVFMRDVLERVGLYMEVWGSTDISPEEYRKGL